MFMICATKIEINYESFALLTFENAQVLIINALGKLVTISLDI